MLIEDPTALLHNPGQLAVLLDALDGVPVSDAERRTLVWLSGWERHTIDNLAAVIGRARRHPVGSSVRNAEDHGR